MTHAAASPAAVAATLQMLRQAAPNWQQLEAAAEQEAQSQASFFKGPDIREGLAAVREKRQPRFEVHHSAADEQKQQN